MVIVLSLVYQVRPFCISLLQCIIFCKILGTILKSFVNIITPFNFLPLVQLFPWQFLQTLTQGKPILRQEQILAPHGVFVESLQLYLNTFNSSAGPGSKIDLLSSKLPLQFFHPQCVGEKSIWSSFFHLTIW